MKGDTASTGLTSLGGLPPYLDLIQASGLRAVIHEHVRVAGRQSWLDELSPLLPAHRGTVRGLPYQVARRPHAHAAGR